MKTLEFETVCQNGFIAVPEEFREGLRGTVKSHRSSTLNRNRF